MSIDWKCGLVNTKTHFQIAYQNLWIVFREIGEAFRTLGDDPDCRVIVMSGNGKMFCSGMFLGFLMVMSSTVPSHDNEKPLTPNLEHELPFKCVFLDSKDIFF